MPPSLPTVFIVDDDPSVCRSLSRVVQLADMEPRTFHSAEAFLQTHPHPSGQASCMVLDLHMPGINGLEFQNRLANSPMSCPVIFISGNGDISVTVKAMRQGAVTFLAKPFDNEDLLAAIREALEKHRAEFEANAQLQVIQQRMSTLTDRETEVMAWIITGALNKQIAAHLNIVEKTVKVHRARVLEKMRASSVAELVRLCTTVGFAAAQ